MHRYREYGLVSDEDEALRRAFRDGFKRAGLSFPRLIEALAWYRDRARPVAAETQLLEAFSEYAADRGWSPDERDGAIETYRAIRDNGPAAVTEAAPGAAEDRAVVARGDDLLRRDSARYWNDGELQDAVFEARERLGRLAEISDGVRAPTAADADRKKIAEIEALLRDTSGAGQRRYWNDAALRDGYAEALGRLAGETPAHAPEGDGAGTFAPAPVAAASPTPVSPPPAGNGPAFSDS
jgi:hypothetical protein